MSCSGIHKVYGVKM